MVKPVVGKTLLWLGRERRQLTQKEVVEHIKRIDPTLGLNENTLHGWEHGKHTPGPAYRKLLSELYQKELRELGWPELPEEIPFWKVPYPSNPYFSGRDEFLEQLHLAVPLRERGATLEPHILMGMPGIGKTEIALSYAYAYKHDYQVIVWLDASSPDVLLSEYMALATLVNLPVHSVQDQSIVTEAVKAWLGAISTWLVVFDNAENLELVYGLLPEPCFGHVVITTRSQTVSPFRAAPFEVKEWDQYQSAQFLLARANYTQEEAEVLTNALKLAHELGGWPLALDQAGAYIDSSKISIFQYLQRYSKRPTETLYWRGPLTKHHPDSLVTTLSMACERIHDMNTHALDLLRLFAFLAPEGIPEDLIVHSNADLGPILGELAGNEVAFDAALRALLAYSLIKRNSKAGTCSLHRLVQEVILDGLGQGAERVWAERAIRAVSQFFLDPDVVEWSVCQRYLPHAQVCIHWIEKWNLVSLEAADLLNNVGAYLRHVDQPKEAQLLYKRAISICSHVLGSKHPRTANGLSYLAACLSDQERYEEAKRLAHRALRLQEQALGPNHRDVGCTLNILGYAYWRLGQYEPAEEYYQRALSVNRASLGPEHPDVALSLNNLGVLYNDMGVYRQDKSKLIEAEAYYQTALTIRERTLGREHPFTVSVENNLGSLYNDLGQFEQAVPYLQRALQLDEQILGFNHPDVVIDLSNLAYAFRHLQNFDQAEALYSRALAIYEIAEKGGDSRMASPLVGLGSLYMQQKRYADAQPLIEKALAIRKQTLGLEHPQTIKTFSLLAKLESDRLLLQESQSKEG